MAAVLLATVLSASGLSGSAGAPDAVEEEAGGCVVDIRLGLLVAVEARLAALFPLSQGLGGDGVDMPNRQGRAITGASVACSLGVVRSGSGRRCSAARDQSLAIGRREDTQVHSKNNSAVETRQSGYDRNRGVRDRDVTDV